MKENIKSEIIQEIEHELGKCIADANARELLSVALGNHTKHFLSRFLRSFTWQFPTARCRKG